MSLESANVSLWERGVSSQDVSQRRVGQGGDQTFFTGALYESPRRAKWRQAVLRAVLRRGSEGYSVPGEKRATTQGPIGEKRCAELRWLLMLLWRSPFPVLPSFWPLCALVLVWSGCCGLRFVFPFLFLTGADPRTVLLSGIPIVYVWGLFAVYLFRYCFGSSDSILIFRVQFLRIVLRASRVAGARARVFGRTPA